MSNIKILIVDDSKIMRMSLVKLLREIGCLDIIEATNGSEALALYKEHKPSLVTMDITMPATDGIADGIAAVEAIIHFDPLAKIIVVSSHSEQSKILQAVKNGASGYLVKPVGLDKLKEWVFRLTGFHKE